MQPESMRAIQKPMPDPSEERFVRATRRVEAVATAPVISGEARRWIRDTASALAELREAWSRRKSRQRKVKRDIERWDPALYHRLTDVAERSQRNRNKLAELQGKLEELEGALDDGATETALRERIWELRDQLVYWSVTVRVLDAELDRWFAESLYRDRGVAD
jgi:hypothetical protein